MADLRYWNARIEELAAQMGLDPYPQEFELCNYEDMLCYEAYLGMPARYAHWSFGKAYERKKTFYRYNLSGLPYEMVINSNPCLAYLMKDNSLLLQILTMAHVYAHNDFFKNNRLFAEGTRAEYTLGMFKSHARRIREYIGDPSIGYVRVERILDAAHALRLQTCRWAGEKILSEDEKRNRLLEKSRPPGNDHPLLGKPAQPELPDLERIPLEPEEDILYFLCCHAKLNVWEKDVLQIVREESAYFLPQLETKIMNEGWASYWHYTLLNRLELPQHLHLEFLKRHNQVVRPHEGSINPYHLGFKIFTDLQQRHPETPDCIFKVRRQERDSSFIRRYLTEKLCQEMNLFAYQKNTRDFTINEIADGQGWKKIRDILANNVGLGLVPCIKVMEVKGTEKVLCLEHEWEGKELHLQYAHETLKYLARLWGGKVRLRTLVRNSFQILESDGQ
jgi:stage V sporulation protein R